MPPRAAVQPEDPAREYSDVGARGAAELAEQTREAAASAAAAEAVAAAEARDAGGGRYSQRAPDHGVTVVSGLARQPSAAPPRPSWPPPPPAPGTLAPQHASSTQADQLFTVAELLLTRGHVSEAVLEAQKAMRLREPSPDQRALYAYMLFRRGGSLSPSVWEHLSRALNEDPKCERALHYRALMQNPKR